MYNNIARRYNFDNFIYIAQELLLQKVIISNPKGITFHQ